ncbi:MAG: hypothetical protein U5K28_02485 [Halobacteriales archaeon]|nr:hypothetical protein [Halobacteriales archaeon]
MRRTTRWTYLGLALFVCGLVLAGSGAAAQLDARQCERAAYIQITNTDRIDGSLDGYDRVAFANLSDENQTLFTAVRDAGGSALTGGELPIAVITRGNDSYFTLVGTESEPCGSWDAGTVVAPLIAGTFAAAVGVPLVRGREHED